VALVVAVVKRFGEHAGGRLAATISYWAFFSIFPLLLAFVTVLNLVLKNNADLRQDLVDGALGQVPVIGSELGADHALGGSWTAIAVGLAGAVWSGLAAARALQAALDVVWDVPRVKLPNGALLRVKAFGFLLILALVIAMSTVASNLTSIFHSATLVLVAGLAATLVIDGAALAVTYRLLTTGSITLRQVWPGTAVGAVALVGIQVLGNWVVERFIKGASDTYGTFAIVIALLSWFFLLSRVVLYCAELNAALAHGTWPRSLFADGTPTAGDLRAAELDAERVRDDRRLPADPALPVTAAAADPPRSGEPESQTPIRGS